VVVAGDLRGLGPREGAPVLYDWTIPNIAPQTLPWLAILALLMLKPNRCAAAWWIWVPLGCVAGLASAPTALGLVEFSGSNAIVLEWAAGLGFGVAAVWLLSSYLGWKHRLRALGGMLLAQVVFSALAFWARGGWEEFMFEIVVVEGVGMGMGVSVLVIAVALTLAGLACRGRYGWLRLSLWLVAALGAVWLLVGGPLFQLILILLQSSESAREVFGLLGMAAGITLSVLLPFLVLSFCSGLYRERLKGLLHLGGAEAPPVIAPVMPAAAAAAGS